ncbi:MAG TPA: V-type ATPase 116kDa subunit family protein [Anaerolineales bacterium]|nr:V-type ATPase 116kDa subunit family protein [Anaerolineales bacterium]
MFFPKAMTEIELIVPSKDLLGVTRVLSNYGVFHQTDSHHPGVASGSANTWQEQASAYSVLERRVQIVMQSLGIDEGQPPSSEFDAMVEIDNIRPLVDQIEEEVKQVSDQLTSERKQMEQHESTLRQLEPVADIDLDISSLRNSRYLYSMLGVMPTANVDRLQTSLARVPNVFLTLRSDSNRPVVWLAGTKANSDVLERAARSAYLDPLSLPNDYQGTPAKIIDSLHRTIENTQRTIDELNKKLAGMAETLKQELRDLLWQSHTSRVLSDAIVRFGQLRYTYVVTGWVQSDDLESLTQRLKTASKEILIETLPTTRSGHNSNVPVALENSKFLKPFQMLVNTYARPRYGELDPTWLIVFMFPFLFGAMFGDIGQGLVLAVLGYLMASKKVKALSGMSGLGGVVFLCGISATLFGFFYGSIFGFEEDVHIFGMTLEPIWLSPIHHIMDVLMVAVGAGVVLLILAYMIGIFNFAVSRERGHLLFGHNGIAGFVLYLSLLGFGGATFGILPVSPTVFLALAIASGLGVMFSEVFIHLVEGHRPLIDSGGIGTYLIQAGVELFEVIISMLSNTLSYVRVGAFAVAHGGLSQAIFILAVLAGGGEEGGIGYWITIVLGNVFIIGFEGLIVGIQTMRLSYYEFFSKFFTGGGMRFEPLTLKPVQEE